MKKRRIHPMKNTTVILIFLFIANLLTAAVSLEIQNVDTGAGTLDVYMINDEPVGGFQFELLGIIITGASAPDGFIASTSSTSVLAFSLTGATIPAGEGILTQVSFTSFNGESICFGEDTGSAGNTAIGDANGNYIAADWGECYSAGSCASGIYDCNGVCDGTAVEDECGVCDGPGAIYECGCNDIPDGECDCAGNVEDCGGECGGSAEQDECGVCNGDGSTCEDFGGVSLEIQNVDTDAGTLDIYMSNYPGCSYCEDSLYNKNSDDWWYKKDYCEAPWGGGYNLGSV